MSEKKYAIVKVQKKCPYYEVISKKCLLDFEDCRKECINIKGKFQYGDTKEQIVRKIAQILFQESPHNVLYTNPDKVVNEFFYNDCLKTATKIVEFLGVE